MTCICGHHEHAHAQDVGLCGSPHGCDCNRFVEAKPEVPVPKPFAEMTGAELRDFLLNQRGTQEQAYAALRDAIRAEAIAERAPMEDTITALRARAERAEQERDENKAVQDAMWLAGSSADTAERNLARVYLALKDEVAGFEAMWEARERAHDAEIATLADAQADKERLDWFDRIWKDDDINALDLAWQSSTPGPAGSGRAAIDAAIAATAQDTR